VSRPLVSAWLAAALCLLAVGTPVKLVAASEVEARRYLEPIALETVGRYHCHDGRHPVITCFDTETERDIDARASTGSTTPSASSQSLASVTATYYVTFYEHANYGGASFTTSQSIAHLGTYGWSDIVSSFKSLNSQRPKWWEHADYGGLSWQWTAGAQVSYVGDGANDRFSSAKNAP
jgi:hypothetical protein